MWANTDFLFRGENMSKQRFSIAFDFEANMNPIVSSVANLKKELSGVSLPSNFAANFEKLFGKLEGEISNFQALTKNGFDNIADVKKAETSFSKISKLFSQISLETSKVKGLDPNKFLPKELQSRTNDLKKKLSELQDQQNKKDDFAKKIEKQNEAISKQRKELQNLEIARKALEDDAKSLGGQKGAATKRRNEAQSNLDAATAKRDKLIAEGAKASNPALQAAKKDIDTYAKAVRDAQTQIDTLSNKLNTNATAMRANGASTEIAERELADLEAQLTQMKNIQVDPQALTALREELAKIQGVNIDQISTDLQEIDAIIDGLDAKELEEIAKKMQKINNVTSQTDDAFDQAKQGMRDFTNTADGLDRAAQDMQNLQRQVQDFFSITNSIQLFKRAVTSALNTVKELDATMTEAAVVTDFTVGDMWDRLPEYSANAQKLGVSINGMYQATTLYYQQGLKTNEAMQLGIETMKMAKIAGMDSAQATEAMTAALRGFNMELNETSATRVNDVYSQLAAVTAADTEQIATAMEKTASIAASANMEFETTAALLAQIIETTQEAPETAGTAMKTIIARFAEVKSLRDQGKNTGTDSEGENIDVNKIQTALRTVGISMDGFFAGTEGLDSVLLKLSEKWDTLDFETQRYIATMAAGSRQQSRFIAMMSDYGRTTELVGQAQNSAGASQKQFEKTQDSLEAKLQKLKNAWDQFLMGLANNEVLKGAVDALTGLVETLSKATQFLSGGNGLIKSVLSLVTAISMLKLGKKALGGGLGFIGQKMGMPGMGATKETITESQDANGNTVKTIIKEPYKQGEQAGQEAARGFNAGLKRGIQNKKEGGSLLKGMFTSKDIADQVNARKERDANIRARNKMSGGDKKNFVSELVQRNSQAGDKKLDTKTLRQEVMTVYETEGADAAIKKYEELGGSLLTLEEKEKLVQQQSRTLGTDFAAAGQAAMGVGAALGLLSGLFESLGMDEAAETTQMLAGVFMGLGTVLSILPSIITFVGTVATTTGITVQAAWWWVVLIVAAVAAIGVAFVALGKAAKAASLEGRMEAAAEATEAARDAAESAKTAYDDLLSAKDDYSEIQKSLENLTKGTDEWKQALLEANSQVLELLNTYPELAQYISKGKFGQLTISQEGWEKILEKQYQGVVNSQANVQISQANETKLSREQVEQDFKNAGYKAGITKRVLGRNGKGRPRKRTVADTEDLALINEQYLRNPDMWVLGEDGEYSQELKEFAESIGQTAEEVYNMKDALIAYNRDMAKLENQNKAQYETMLTSTASQDTLDYEYGDDVISGFANTMSSETYAAREKQIADEVHTKDGGADKDNNTRFQELAEQYEVTNQMVGDDLKDLQTLYAAMAGISKDEIPDSIKGDKEKLAAEIGKMQAASELTNMMEEFRKNMETKLDKTSQRQVAALMSGNASNLTMSELQSMQGKGITDYATDMGYGSPAEMAKAMGYDTLTLSQMSTEDQEAYIRQKIAEGDKNAQKYLNDDGTVNVAQYVQDYGSTEVSGEQQLQIDSDQAAQQMEEIYNKSTGAISEKLGIDKEAVATKFANTSIGAIEGISNQIAGMSTENATAYVNAWENVVEGSDLGESQKRGMQEYLAGVDWSNMTEAVEAMDYMQSQGMDPAKIQEFWNTATNGARTYVSTIAEALSLTERILGKVNDVEGITNRLAEGSGTYADVQEMIAAGIDVSKFQLTDDGWKLNAEDAEQGKALLYNHYAQQADATAQSHEDSLNEAKATSGELGMYQDSEGNWREVSAAGGTQSTFASLTSTSDDGKLVAGSVDTVGTADQIAKELGFTERGEEETEEDYLARIQSEYEAYLELLNNGDEISIINEKAAAYANVKAAQADLNAGAKEINDNWSKWSENLSGDNLKAFGDATKKMLGITTDLSDEFLQNAKNQELIRKAADGNVDAMKQLRKEAAKDLFKKLGESGSAAFERIKGDIDDIVNADIEVGVTVTMDSDDPNNGIAGKLTNMYNEAYQAAIAGGKSVAEAQQAANDAINDVGYDAPEMVAEETTIIGELPPGLSVGENGTVVSTGTGEVVQGYNWTQTDSGEYQYTYTRFAPKEDTGFTKVSNKVGDTGGDKGGGGGGGSKKYENSYDKFYNTYEKINQVLREREKLERAYDKILKNRKTTLKALLDNAQDQLDALKEERDLQEYLQKGKAQEIQDYLDENSEYSQYASFDPETGTISIDWDAINAITDEEKGQEVEEFISGLEELRDQWQEAQDAIDDIDDTVDEIRDQGKDEYFDLETKIKDALESQRQEEIDKLSEINESINDTNSRLLDAMQTSLDEYRQERDNQKTEEEIADKQQKLAYLQMDTSGANQLEILQLQEEIDQAQEDYTDTLIDQKISELQQQNDEAAEQRQTQIDLMQSQLDQYIESGAVWKDVYTLMGSGIDENGIIVGSDLWTLLTTQEDYASMSNLEKLQWAEDLKDLVAQAIQWLTVGNSTEALLKAGEIAEGDSITFTTADGRQVTGTIQADGTVLADGKTYSDVYRNYDGSYVTTENYQGVATPDPEPEPDPEPPKPTEADKKGAAGAILRGGLGWGNNPDRAKRLTEVFGANNGIQKNYVNKGIYAGNPSDYSYEKMKKKFVAYKTGGLADFTGPAWLDGTKSKPEYILNADQTKAFFQLIDILGGISTGSTKPAQNSGDNTYDIDINVESIGSDYDVDQLADKVKRLINEDARYRNNNTAGFMR